MTHIQIHLKNSHSHTTKINLLFPPPTSHEKLVGKEDEYVLHKPNGHPHA